MKNKKSLTKLASSLLCLGFLFGIASCSNSTNEILFDDNSNTESTNDIQEEDVVIEYGFNLNFGHIRSEWDEWNIAVRATTGKATSKEVEVHYGHDRFLPVENLTDESDLNQKLRFTLIRNVYNSYGNSSVETKIRSTTIKTIEEKSSYFLSDTFVFRDNNHVIDTINTDDLFNVESDGFVLYEFIIVPAEDEELKLYRERLGKIYSDDRIRKVGAGALYYGIDSERKISLSVPKEPDGNINS